MAEACLWRPYSWSQDVFLGWLSVIVKLNSHAMSPILVVENCLVQYAYVVTCVVSDGNFNKHKILIAFPRNLLFPLVLDLS